MKQVGWLIRDTSRSKSTRIFTREGVAPVYILLSLLSEPKLFASVHASACVCQF